MSFRRLTISAAVHKGRRHVAYGMRSDGQWLVTWSYPDGSPGRFYAFADQRQAIAKARELRIFVTLLALGIESNEALPFAANAAPNPGAIAEIIADYMQRR